MQKSFTCTLLILCLLSWQNGQPPTEIAAMAETRLEITSQHMVTAV
jgi:hypothetical protein